MNKEVKQYFYIGIIALLFVFIGIYLVTSNPYSSQQTALLNNTGIIPSTNIKETIPAQNISIPIQSSVDFFTINAQVPETPRYVPLYKGTLSDDDRNKYFKYESSNWLDRKNHTPTKSEAPAIAEKALAAYGGLPKDAVLSGVFISESITEKTSGVITERYPILTQVFYQRQINGIPVVGERDIISVDLGENGELLAVMKRWRTLEQTGEIVPVIPPEKASKKLLRGETYTKCQSSGPFSIDDIQLSYYEKPGKLREIFLEPVWNFRDTRQNGCEFPVYARQFAKFTVHPVAGKVLVTEIFIDTSDASPTKWQWDFGDGTTSAEQNPTHHYKTAGTYNVTLTVWNDMGSDSIVQQYTVTDIPVKTAETTVAVNATTTTTITQNSTLTASNATIIPTTTASPTATITVNETVITTATATINPNVTATSPVPTDTVSITPTTSLNITPVTTTGNSTAG